MDKIFGLPAHPFLVHIPVVLLPLAALGVVLMAIRPVWYRQYRWLVLGIGFVGTLGAVLAASAGEELETRIVAVEGADAASSWERHAELGDTARLFAVIFFVTLLLFVLVPWFMERRAAGSASGTATTEVAGDSATAPVRRSSSLRAVTIAVSVLAVLGATASVVTVGRAGHTGSQSVWADYVAKTGG